MLLFADSFDHYVTADLTEKWTAVGAYGPALSPTITAAGRTSNALTWTTATTKATNGLALSPAHAPSDSTCIVGFAFKVASLGDYNFGAYGHTFGIWNGGDYKCGFKVLNNGTIGFGTSDYSYISSGVPVQDGRWAYIECKVVLHDSTGSVVIKVNGTVVLSQTNIDTIYTGTAAWNGIDIQGARTGPTAADAVLTNSNTVLYDDFYLLDGSVGTGRANNDFLGDISVRYLVPTSDSAVTWDRGGTDSGANFSQVSESSPDDDSKYVTTATVDEIDYYGFPDVTVGADIYGVQAVISAKKADTGSAQIAACVKTSGGSDREHPSPLGIASDSAYSYFLFPWDGSPETSLAWTESEVNGAAFGPRKTL